MHIYMKFASVYVISQWGLSSLFVDPCLLPEGRKYILDLVHLHTHYTHKHKHTYTHTDKQTQTHTQEHRNLGEIIHKLTWHLVC